MWHEKQRIFLFKIGLLQCCRVFSVISLWYEVPNKHYHDNIRSFVYNFVHYTVWNLTKCYCVTSLDLFRISPWKNKQLNIHFQSNTFCVIKSPLKKIKYESHYYFQHIILISELQKMGRLKCHTVTSRDFHLSCTLIWLFATQSPLKSHSEHQY